MVMCLCVFFFIFYFFTDDRLISILHHQNFPKELQEIAVEGSKERAQLQRDAGSPDSTTQTPHTAADVADRSMLEALGGPGERSILSQKRRLENTDREEGKDEHELKDEESHEGRDSAEEAQVKRDNDEKPGSHISESADKEKTEEEEHDVVRGDAGENSQENVAKDKKKGGRSGDKEDGRRNKPKEKTFGEEAKKQEEKRSAFFSHKHKAKAEDEDEGETEGESWGSVKRWVKRDKALKRKMAEEEAEHHHIQQEEVPHHSKEISDEEEEATKKKRGMQRSPEEKELQMIARRPPPEERQGVEEEGSASRKPEEPEIESLAAIESELENVAQKLHELRRG
ncbi:uncharacterized protein V6R79_001802 [Siganus canaliculatus]